MTSGSNNIGPHYKAGAERGRGLTAIRLITAHGACRRQRFRRYTQFLSVNMVLVWRNERGNAFGNARIISVAGKLWIVKSSIMIVNCFLAFSEMIDKLFVAHVFEIIRNCRIHGLISSIIKRLPKLFGRVFV